MRRNLSGDKLFVFVDSKLVSIDNQDVKIIPAPADYSFCNEKGEFVAWFNNLRGGVYFKNGYVRPLKLEERFGVDYGGSYFYISTYSNHSSAVYAISQPETPILTIPSFAAGKIFFYDHTIYVFGSRPSKAGTVSYRDVCYEIIQSNNTYYVQRSFDVPWGIVDMSPRTKRLLLCNGYEFITLWFLYDMETGKKRLVSSTGGSYEFFITPDLAARFKERK